MRTLARRTAVSLTAPVILLCGCFSYVAAPLDAVPEGQDVRVHLTRQGMAQLPETFDISGEFLTGTLVKRENERLFLRVPVGRREEGFYVSQIGQDVSVPTREIMQLEQRKLNRGSTAFFVAGTAAAAAAVVFVIMEATGRTDQPTPPEPEVRRVPLFSIPVR